MHSERKNVIRMRVFSLCNRLTAGNFATAFSEGGKMRDPGNEVGNFVDRVNKKSYELYVLSQFSR